MDSAGDVWHMRIEAPCYEDDSGKSVAYVNKFGLCAVNNDQ